MWDVIETLESRSTSSFCLEKLETWSCFSVKMEKMTKEQSWGSLEKKIKSSIVACSFGQIGFTSLDFGE